MMFGHDMTPQQFSSYKKTAIQKKAKKPRSAK